MQINLLLGAYNQGKHKRERHLLPVSHAVVGRACPAFDHGALGLVFIAKQMHASASLRLFLCVVQIRARLHRQASVNGVVLHFSRTASAVNVMEAIHLPTDNLRHARPLLPPEPQSVSARMYLPSSKSATPHASSSSNCGTGMAKSRSVTTAINSCCAQSNLLPNACLKTSILGLSSRL